MSHIPVMLNEVIEALQPEDGKIYVDGTFGAGGYSRAFLDRAPCRVVGIDRDETALAMAQDWKRDYAERLVLLHGAFGGVRTLLDEAGFKAVDGFVLDLGVSSMQLDQAERGFSFRFDGPLDMRMDRSTGISAADLVNEKSEEELTSLIKLYGEERFARRVARAIVKARAEEPFSGTARFAEVVRGSIPYNKKEKTDPATRTFQALRIVVNDELGELERALEASEQILSEGGRLVIVTFHSLEDRIVKKFLKERSGDLPSPSRHLPVVPDENAQKPTFRQISRKALEASDEEAKENPRARSAKLRAAVRTAAPCWSVSKKQSGGAYG